MTTSAPDPICQAYKRGAKTEWHGGPRERGERCTHGATFAFLLGERVVFTCGIHNPSRAQAAHGYADDEIDLEKLHPVWLDTLSRLYAEQSSKLRLRAGNLRGQANMCEATAQIADGRSQRFEQIKQSIMKGKGRKGQKEGRV